MIRRYLNARIEEGVAKRIEAVEAAVEERAGYADLLLAGLEATVSGSAGDVLRTSAVETAGRIWAGALSAATVSGGRGVLTPEVLSMTGRQLVRNGEIVFVIEIVDGRVQLYPVAEWEVLDGYRYRCEILSPPGRSVSRIIPSSGVLHWKWATDPREPWRGVSPMAAAALGAKVAANTETRLSEETSAPTALLLPIPSDGGDPKLDQLRQDIGAARGKAVLIEGTASGWDEGAAKRTLADWAVRRVGPEVPQQLRELHEDSLQRVLAACGIPGSLASVGADGTQLREDYRRFIMLAVQPLARELAGEAGRKLEDPVEFGFHGLHAHDIVARSNAYAKLREAGVGDGEARRLAGLQ